MVYCLIASPSSFISLYELPNFIIRFDRLQTNVVSSGIVFMQLRWHYQRKDLEVEVEEQFESTGIS
jgi:hypothetical protein